jgi:hypothetical protein
MIDYQSFLMGVLCQILEFMFVVYSLTLLSSNVELTQADGAKLKNFVPKLEP